MMTTTDTLTEIQEVAAALVAANPGWRIEHEGDRAMSPSIRHTSGAYCFFTGDGPHRVLLISQLPQRDGRTGRMMLPADVGETPAERREQTPRAGCLLPSKTTWTAERAAAHLAKILPHAIEWHRRAVDWLGFWFREDCARRMELDEAGQRLGVAVFDTFDNEPELHVPLGRWPALQLRQVYVSDSYAPECVTCKLEIHRLPLSVAVKLAELAQELTR